MGTVVSRPKFTPCPAGPAKAVLVDVDDLGIEVHPKFGSNPKVNLIWETEHENPDRPGTNFTVRRKYTKSLGKRANLYKDLAAWLGRDLTEAEFNSFDLDDMLGTPCQIFVIHTTREGNTYANLQGISPDKSDRPFEGSGTYVMKRDREDDGDQSNVPF